MYIFNNRTRTLIAIWTILIQNMHFMYSIIRYMKCWEKNLDIKSFLNYCYDIRIHRMEAFQKVANHTKITTFMKIRVRYRDLNNFCCPRNWRIAIQIQNLFEGKALSKVYTTFSCTCIWSAYLSHRMWRVFQFAPRPFAAKKPLHSRFPIKPISCDLYF